MTDPITDRQQRARIEYYDDCASRRDAVEGDAIALDAAIKVATQVKITKDIVQAMHDAGRNSYRSMAEAAFRAAGFEVVE